MILSGGSVSEPALANTQDSLLQRSLANAQSSVTLLQHAVDSCASTELGSTPNVALVKYRVADGMVVTYIQFRLQGGSLQGQRIFADEHDRLTYSVHFMIPYKASTT